MMTVALAADATPLLRPDAGSDGSESACATRPAAVWLAAVAQMDDDADAMSGTGQGADEALESTTVDMLATVVAIPSFDAAAAPLPSGYATGPLYMNDRCVAEDEPDGVLAGDASITGLERRGEPVPASRARSGASVRAPASTRIPAWAPAAALVAAHVRGGVRDGAPCADGAEIAFEPSADDAQSPTAAGGRLLIAETRESRPARAPSLSDWGAMPDNAAVFRAMTHAAVMPTQPASAAGARDERARLVAELGERIAVLVSQRAQYASVRLDSESRGPVTIELRYQRGAVSVVLSAGDADVVRQLQAIGENLRHELGTRQFQDVSVHVSRRGEQETADGRPRRDDSASEQDSKPGAALASAGGTGTFKPA